MGDINFLSTSDKEKEEREKKPKVRGPIEFYEPKEEKEFADEAAAPKPPSPIEQFFKKLFKSGKKSAASKKESEKESSVESKIDPLAIPTPETKPLQPKGIAAQAGMKRPAPGGVADEMVNFRNIDVNLMPWSDPMKEYKQFGRIALVVISVLIVGIWGTILQVGNSSLESQITRLEQEIVNVDGLLKDVDVSVLTEGSESALKQEKYLELYGRIPQWSKFFEWLESHTDERVYFSQINVSTPNAIALDVHAPDYYTAAQQWLVFKNDTEWVESVIAQNFTFTEAGEEDENRKSEVVYTVNLDLHENTLWNNPQLPLESEGL